MLARDFLLETFKQYGVQYLFGNPGTTELPLIDGLIHFPEIEFIVSLHEDICVGMAAGYAQATGKPGVINLHASPGLAHGMGNIYNAFRAGVPLIVTAGQQDSRLAVQEPALWGDMISMVRNYTKWSWEIKTASELPVVLHRAFKTALTEPMGPVFLSLPSDIMWQDVDANPLPFTSISPNIRGDRSAIQKTVELLRKAATPIIVAGDRVHSTGAVEDLVQLALLLGAKVYIEHQSSALNFPYGNPHFAGRFLPNGPYIQNALLEADVIVYIGVISQAPLLYFDSPLVQQGTKVVAIDNSEWEIAKNMHVEIPILGSTKTIIQEVFYTLQETMTEEDSKRFEINRERTFANYKQRLEKRRNERVKSAGSPLLSPALVIDELDQILPDNALIVDESVTTGKYVHEYLQLNEPGSLIALKGGGLGYGMPAAVGAQLGCPEKRVVNIIGDGSSLYYIQSLWNAAKFDLPIVFVIINNQSYMILKGGLLQIDGESAKNNFFPGMDLTDPAIDFVKVAHGFGINALRIEKSDDLKPAFQNSFNEKQPILLDIAVDPTVEVFLK